MCITICYFVPHVVVSISVVECYSMNRFLHLVNQLLVSKEKDGRVCIVEESDAKKQSLWETRKVNKTGKEAKNVYVSQKFR